MQIMLDKRYRASPTDGFMLPVAMHNQDNHRKGILV